MKCVQSNSIIKHLNK